MSTLITKDNLKVVLKYFMLGIMLVIGMIMTVFLVEAIFNLGVYFGTFLRNVYNLVCCG